MTRSMIRLAGVSALALVLAGCFGEDEAPEPAARHVLSIVAKSAGDRRPSFSGSVQPRYETDRGFQVLGRIIARNVDVGDLVKAGQRLAENEPVTYQLEVQSAEADLARARAELDRASASRGRVATLVGKKISPQSDLDAAERTLEAAQASVRVADANLVKARENLRYTSLVADADGVVTHVYADVGQTATPGMRVLTIARTDIREAVVDLPEDVVRFLKVGSPFETALQADPTITSAGEVREIAPQADAATRLRRVRITLARSVDPFRLGSTVTVTPQVATGPREIAVPATAVFERDGRPHVWVVDATSKSVGATPIEIAAREGGVALVRAGLPAGSRVVTAGVHTLKDGQAIALNEGASQ